MAAAGAVLAESHDALAAEVAVGVTTARLDGVAEELIRWRGGVPAFKGYPGPTAFPASICTSVNDQVVHGIPNGYALRDGDVLSLDVGVILDGWVADAARTHAVGAVSPIAARLIEVTRARSSAGIAAAGSAAGWATSATRSQTEVEAAGLLGGAEPGGPRGRALDARGAPGPELRPAGHRRRAARGPRSSPSSRWSTPAATRCSWATTAGPSPPSDGSLSAHWEHTVAVTADGPRILTLDLRPV